MLCCLVVRPGRSGSPTRAFFTPCIRCRRCSSIALCCSRRPGRPDNWLWCSVCSRGVAGSPAHSGYFRAGRADRRGWAAGRSLRPGPLRGYSPGGCRWSMWLHLSWLFPFRCSRHCRGGVYLYYGDTISRFTVIVNRQFKIYRNFIFQTSRQGLGGNGWKAPGAGDIAGRFRQGLAP